MAGLIRLDRLPSYLRGNLGAWQELKGLWMVGPLEEPEPDVVMTMFYHREAVALDSPGQRTKAAFWEHRSWLQEAPQACLTPTRLL